VSNIPTATLTPLIPLSEDEAFDIPNVAPGRYSVELLDSTGDATLDSRIVEVNASDLTDVLLEQRAPVTLTGHVSLEHQNTPNGLRLLLVPADRRLSARPPAIGYIKKDGTFAISNVQPDTYFARLLGAPDGLYIKELILGRQKSDNDKINVSGNETLDVILDRATNDIEGTIDSSVRKDDSGTENLSVVAIADSQDPDPSTIWVSPVDSSGTFHLRNVRPGVIRLFAAPKSTPMDAWLTSQFLALMADKQTSVTVPQFGSARTTLPAIITNNELQEACLQLGVDIR
jgi:hypothetical protein